MEKGNLTFINENITFKCATLNVIILYANNKKILHKAKTRANPSPWKTTSTSFDVQP